MVGIERFDKERSGVTRGATKSRAEQAEGERGTSPLGGEVTQAEGEVERGNCLTKSLSPIGYERLKSAKEQKRKTAANKVCDAGSSFLRKRDFEAV